MQRDHPERLPSVGRPMPMVLQVARQPHEPSDDPVDAECTEQAQVRQQSDPGARAVPNLVDGTVEPAHVADFAVALRTEWVAMMAIDAGLMHELRRGVCRIGRSSLPTIRESTCSDCRFSATQAA